MGEGRQEQGRRQWACQNTRTDLYKKRRTSRTPRSRTARLGRVMTLLSCLLFLEEHISGAAIVLRHKRLLPTYLHLQLSQLRRRRDTEELHQRTAVCVSSSRPSLSEVLPVLTVATQRCCRFTVHSRRTTRKPGALDAPSPISFTCQHSTLRALLP